MNNSILYYSVVTFLFLIGCKVSKNDLVGVYVKTPSKNTIDSLFLYENNRYRQIVYYKSGELFGVNENSWDLNENKINMMNFYLNDDSDLNEYKKQEDGKINEALLIPSLLIISNNKIIINKSRKIYYEKIR